MRLLNIRQVALCVMVMTVFIIGTTQAQQKSGVFYAVYGNGLKDTSWLFGTYHLINDAYLQETPKVTRAFQKAENLVVEVVLDTSGIAAANAKSLLDNKRLTELLDNGFADSLDAELKASIGQGIEQFQAVKPMAVMLTLSIVHLMKENQQVFGKYTGMPLDAYFSAKNKSDGKKVVALETINQQMDLLFNTISDREQGMMLQQFLRNKAQSVKLGNALLKAYFDNDIEKIYAVYTQSIQTSGDMDFLIKRRNDQWMKELPALFNSQSSFVAVGALHLAGPDGLVNQLRSLGYMVTAENLR